MILRIIYILLILISLIYSIFFKNDNKKVITIKDNNSSIDINLSEYLNNNNLLHKHLIIILKDN